MYGHERHHGHHGCGCREHHRYHGEQEYEQEWRHLHHERPGEPGPAFGGGFGPRPPFGGGFGPGRRFHRRFMTRAEVVERLEAYLHDLETEAQAVKERIEALKAEGEATG